VVSFFSIMDMLLVLFLFVVFMAIVGLELFSGSFHNRCFDTDAAGNVLGQTAVLRLCK
jgi:hypothetical protein